MAASSAAASASASSKPSSSSNAVRSVSGRDERRPSAAAVSTAVALLEHAAAARRAASSRPRSARPASRRGSAAAAASHRSRPADLGQPVAGRGPGVEQRAGRSGARPRSATGRRRSPRCGPRAGPAGRASRASRTPSPGRSPPPRGWYAMTPAGGVRPDRLQPVVAGPLGDGLGQGQTGGVGVVLAGRVLGPDRAPVVERDAGGLQLLGQLGVRGPRPPGRWRRSVA